MNEDDPFATPADPSGDWPAGDPIDMGLVETVEVTAPAVNDAPQPMPMQPLTPVIPIGRILLAAAVGYAAYRFAPGKNRALWGAAAGVGAFLFAPKLIPSLR